MAAASRRSSEDAGTADATADGAVEGQTIKIAASATPQAEILEQVKPILAEQGITLEITVFDDYVLPMTVVESGELDANYAVHVPYLESFNEEQGTHLANAGGIHYEPFGIYPGTKASLSEVAQGDVIAVPNDTTNEARALLLLEQEGLIELDESAGINATIADITDNSHNLQFIELAPEQLASSLPDVDIAIINGNYAIEGGLDVNDALAVEANDGLAAQTYGNIIATSPENADNPAVIALVEVLQGPEVSAYIAETYDGAVVPLF